MRLADLKREVVPGTLWEVTNHYISCPDHPCYGTQPRRVVHANTTGFRLALDGVPEGSHVDWPKASQIAESEDGAILIYGGGASQDAERLFLTMRRGGVA